MPAPSAPAPPGLDLPAVTGWLHSRGLADGELTAQLVAGGLGDFGRPQGFMARQVRRWGQQLDASRSRDLPGVDDLRARLAATVPPDAAVAVVHGDYRLDNLVVDLAGPAGPTVRAVLD